MKIYIVTDMEGISGIRREDEVDQLSPNYSKAQKLLCGDVNAAIAGAFDGGATEVHVADGHASGFNFLMEDMDSRAIYERPNGGRDLFPSLNETFDGVFCVGYHAMAGTLNAFLDHTQSPNCWQNYYLNGRRAGELAQVGAWAGTYGVPVILVTGDQAACDEAKDFLGNDIETVAVKQGLGRQFARCIHPEKSRVMIREAAVRSLKLTQVVQPYSLKTPLTVRVEFCRTDYADAYHNHSTKRRIDARTIEWVTDDPRMLLDM